MQQPKAPPNFRVYEFNGSAGATWSAPVPLVGQIEREAYPLDALPPAIRGAVEEVQDAVQAPAEMVASSALAVVSLAAQSLADVSRSKTLPGPSSLYFLTVAEFGDRKSTVDRLMGRAIHDFQDAQRDASKTAIASHAADMAAWEAERDATSGKMSSDAKGGKSIDGHRADLAQIESKKPLPPRIPRLDLRGRDLRNGLDELSLPNGRAAASSPVKAAPCWAATAWARTASPAPWRCSTSSGMAHRMLSIAPLRQLLGTRRPNDDQPAGSTPCPGRLPRP